MTRVVTRDLHDSAEHGINSLASAVVGVRPQVQHPTRAPPTHQKWIMTDLDIPGTLADRPKKYKYKIINGQAHPVLRSVSVGALLLAEVEGFLARFVAFPSEDDLVP